ncbi:MAG: hypothetical protein CMJ14_02225 [Pelagibacterales bacterium]|nr:hypothetical protein [Pelagibacterales bacterium]
MLDLWVIITILAAFSQNLRSAFQKKLQNDLSDIGATNVRFLFGLPFAIIYFLFLHNSYEVTLTSIPNKFILFTIIGGVSQIIATFLLLKIFNYKNFAVGTTYSKTEPIQALFFSILILGETISYMGMIGIIIGIFGVIFISYKSDKLSYDNKPDSKNSIYLGLLSGALFGIAAVMFRGASLSLNLDNLLYSSGLTLLVALFIQTTLLGIYLIITDKNQILLSFDNLKDCTIVGFFGALASMCWFYAMSIQNVAYVRALGQIELVFTILMTLIYFKEKISFREIIGICFILIGITVIILNS